MRAFLFSFYIYMSLTTLVVAQDQRQPTADEIDCKREELLRAQQEAVDNMSAEEITTTLTQTQELIAAQQENKRNDSAAQHLALLLEQVHQEGKVKIEDCTQLSIEKATAKAQKLLRQIRQYCQKSPQGFWAEITPEGNLKFTFSTSSTSGVKSLTLGGDAGITLSYRGHALQLTGSASKATVGSDAGDSGTTKYDAMIDYSINIGITNLESFLKWKTSFEGTESPTATSSIRRNNIDLGLRYVFFDSETMTMKLGGGLGVSHLSQRGSTIDDVNQTRPSASVSYDFNYHPNKLLEMYLKASLQRDIAGDSPSSVYGGKGGVNIHVGPVYTGVEYSADYDSARKGDRVNHQVTANLGASLNPDDWRDQEKVKKDKARREREAIVWQRALERIHGDKTNSSNE